MMKAVGGSALVATLEHEEEEAGVALLRFRGRGGFEALVAVLLLPAAVSMAARLGRDCGKGEGEETRGQFLCSSESMSTGILSSPMQCTHSQHAWLCTHTQTRTACFLCSTRRGDAERGPG